MHNWYFIEIHNGREWERLSRYDIYYDFNDAVDSAKALRNKYNGVRVIDECYGRTWWENE